MKQWRQFPKRECKRAVVDICSICGVDIIKGQKYFDKGTFQRVHEHCAPPEIKEAELPASNNTSSPEFPNVETVVERSCGNSHEASVSIEADAVRRAYKFIVGNSGR